VEGTSLSCSGEAYIHIPFSPPYNLKDNTYPVRNPPSFRRQGAPVRSTHVIRKLTGFRAADPTSPDTGTRSQARSTRAGRRTTPASASYARTATRSGRGTACAHTRASARKSCARRGTRTRTRTPSSSRTSRPARAAPSPLGSSSAPREGSRRRACRRICAALRRSRARRGIRRSGGMTLRWRGSALGSSGTGALRAFRRFFSLWGARC
jgi:hypothetical protein